MSKKPARRSPKIWSAEATSAFLRCTVEAYEAAELNKKGVHKKITLALNALLEGVPNESEISEEQVRHKYEGFKKQWVQWQGLCNKTGAGWDPFKGTVTGTNEWWSDHVKEYGSNILKYKSGPIEDMKMLQMIYECIHATGEGAFTPSTHTTHTTVPSTPQHQTTQTQFDQTWAYDLNEDYHELPSQHVPPVPPFEGSSFIPPPQNIGPSVIPPPHSSSSKGKGSRRRRTVTEDKMNEIVDMLHEKHMSKKSRSSTASPITPNSLESTYHAASSNFVSRVEKFIEVPIAQAMSILKLKENKEMFDCLDDDIAREWLKLEIEKEKINLEYKQYKMKKSG